MRRTATVLKFRLFNEKTQLHQSFCFEEQRPEPMRGHLPNFRALECVDM